MNQSKIVLAHTHVNGSVNKEQRTETMDPIPKTMDLRHYPRQRNLEVIGGARPPCSYAGVRYAFAMIVSNCAHISLYIPNDTLHSLQSEGLKM